MRFESVIAHAFGPFSGQRLDFSSGMNVLFGLNEAGKSSWHAALYAGLCGIRRGRGAVRNEDQEFDDRHRPWGGSAWAVSATIAIQDGRRMELRHDLDGRVDCRAHDADLGRDYSAEIIHDGAPDGSRLLGLDRRSFLSVACVRQADILGVHKDAAALQVHLQRAAATSGADATAAQALERLDQFRRAQVGRDLASSKGPLRRAIVQLNAARSALANAREQRRSYLELCAQVEMLAEQADAAQHELRVAQAGRASREAQAWSARLSRASALAEHFPQGPPAGLAADDDLSQAAAATLRAWQERPPTSSLTGPSALEIEAHVATLPVWPDGDLEPHPEVRAARETFRDAHQAEQRHARDRVPTSPAPGSGGLSEQELRILANDLGAQEPALDPRLKADYDAARARLEQVSARGSRRWTFFVAAVALAVAGAGAVLSGLLVPGLVLLALGVVAVVWSTVSSSDRARLKATEALQQAERALGEQQFRVDEIRRRREAARQRAADAGVPADPQALEQRAQGLSVAAQAQRELDRWQQKQESLAQELRSAESDLWAALRGRGVEVTASVAEALGGYELDCRSRAVVAEQARQRDALLVRLEARRREEQVALDAAQRQLQATLELRQVAARCGVPPDGDEALAGGIQDWQRRRAALRMELEVAGREWAELQALLGGKTLPELRAEAERRDEAARRAAAGLDSEAVRTAALHSDPEADLERLAQEAEDAARDLHGARGQMDERARSLPSVAEAEEALAVAEAELERVRRLDRTLQLTQDFLKRAQDSVHRTIAPVLATSVRRWLPAVTANRYQDVRIDPQTLDVQVRDPACEWRSAILLSHGTAEQVYLLLRVAMAEHLTRPGEVCPLVLDDVTVQSDRHRTEAILCTLHTLSQERQVILFTQEDDVLAWAEANLQPPADRLQRLELRSVTT